MDSVIPMLVRVIVKYTTAAHTSRLHPVVLPSIGIGPVGSLPRSNTFMALRKGMRYLTRHIFILCKRIVVSIAGNTSIIVAQIPITVYIRLFVLPVALVQSRCVIIIGMWTSSHRLIAIAKEWCRCQILCCSTTRCSTASFA